MPIAAPIKAATVPVNPAWIDENGHMNVAYYLQAFDNAFYDVYRAWGVDFAAIEQTGYSTFAVENHITYQGELVLGDSLSIEVILVDFDRKRIRWFMTMRHAEKGFVAATCEWLLLFMNMTERKVAAMPDHLFNGLAEIKAAHDSLPRPKQLGRSISVENRRVD